VFSGFPDKWSLLTLLMIAGVPNTGVVVVTLADSGLIGSIS